MIWTYLIMLCLPGTNKLQNIHTSMLQKKDGKTKRRKGTSTHLLCMKTKMNKDVYTATFDTDSHPLGIDNRCTACISHDVKDFIGPLTDTDKSIKGFGGTTQGQVKIGTLKWRMEDDNGKIHIFKIPHSYYAPHGGVRLLSPQHWAKSLKEKGAKFPKETTYHTHTSL